MGLGGCFYKSKNTKDCRKAPEARREAWDTFLVTALPNSQLCLQTNTFISGVQPPGLGNNELVLFRSPLHRGTLLPVEAYWLKEIQDTC